MTSAFDILWINTITLGLTAFGYMFLAAMCWNNATRPEIRLKFAARGMAFAGLSLIDLISINNSDLLTVFRTGGVSFLSSYIAVTVFLGGDLVEAWRLHCLRAPWRRPNAAV